MKNSLMLLPVFFLALLVSLAVCPFLYSLSRPEAFAVIAGGDGASFFAINLQNALDFAPTAIVLAFSAVFVYIVRRRIEGVGCLLVFLALLVLSVALIEPAAVRMNAGLRLREAERAQAPPGNGPPAGLIQERAPNIKTVVLQGSAGAASPVLIEADTSGRAGGRALNVHGGREASRVGARSPALDLQVAQKIEEPSFLRRLSRDIGAVHAILFAAASASAGAYIWTAGSFFALAASFFFLCALTDGKLINFTLYAAAIRGLYWLFPLLHGDAAQGFLMRFLPFPNVALAALPALLIAAALAALGFALILPRYERRNIGGIFQ